MLSGKRIYGLVAYVAGKEAITSQCKMWEHQKDNLEFDIDGIVIKVDDFEL